MRIIRLLANKYVISIAIFLIILIANNHIGTNRDLQQQIEDKNKILQEERDKINAIEQYILQIQRDPVMQEEFVRNHYYLKKPNEDIFRMIPTEEKNSKKR